MARCAARGRYVLAVPLFEPVFAALTGRQVRFVVVGGVAVVLHGHARLTADLDLVVDLAVDPAREAIEGLLDLGLRPRLPVDARDFADPAVRGRWVSERAMTVFSLHDPDDPMRVVDLFAEPPVAFEELWQRSVAMLVGRTTVQVASIEDLVAMKRLAGRPQDLTDIAALEDLRRRPDAG